MRTRADEVLEELSTLAAGLCQDAGIGIQSTRGERWSYDPVRRIISIPEDALVKDGRDLCAGHLANEVGHFWLTRHDLFELSFPSSLVGRILLDLLDDPRVDRFMAARYPGVRRWRALVAGSVERPVYDPHLPAILIFCVECLFEGLQGPSPSPDLPRAAALALEATRPAREALARCVPSDMPGQSPLGESSSRRYLEEVRPRLLRTQFVPPRAEIEIQLCAADALQIAREQILPHAQALLEADLSRFADFFADHPAERESLQEIIDQGGAAALCCQAGADGSGAEPSEADYLAALTLVEAMFRSACEGSGGEAGEIRASVCRSARPGEPGRSLARGKAAGAPLSLPSAPLTPYNQAYLAVADQIERLVEHLRRVLEPRQRLRQRAGYPTGRRVDLRKLMAFEADPRRYDELWMRSSIPERRRAVFSLLVDLSGSMRGEKANAALLGTVLLAETLHRLQVPFAINGFQDVLVPLAPFRDPFGTHTKQQIATIPSEVDGTKPGGNNQPSYNDDAPCLLEAADELLAEPAEDRLLIVVSDGLPAGCRSTPEDLPRAIALLGKTPLTLLGMGLGPETEHVKTYYPRSVASVPLLRFADEIGALIQEGLRADTRAGTRSGMSRFGLTSTR